MTLTAENAKQYKREFKQMCEFRRKFLRNVRSFSPENLPLPKGMSDIAIDGKIDSAMLRGITEEHFCELNDTQVFVYADKTKFARPRLSSDGKVMRDEAGAVIVRTFEVPRGSLLVSTAQKVEIPRFVRDSTGSQIPYKAGNAGFMYATMSTIRKADGTSGKQFFYVIPKKYIYPLNYCALVLSVNPRRAHAFYYSERVLLQNGCTVYLSVMPIKKVAQSKDQQRIIFKALKCDMRKEISYLLAFLAQQCAVTYPNGYSLAYAFPPEQSVLNCSEFTENLAVTVISNAMNALDSDLYLPCETLSLEELEAAKEAESEEIF